MRAWATLPRHIRRRRHRRPFDYATSYGLYDCNTYDVYAVRFWSYVAWLRRNRAHHMNARILNIRASLSHWLSFSFIFFFLLLCLLLLHHRVVFIFAFYHGWCMSCCRCQVRLHTSNIFIYNWVHGEATAAGGARTTDMAYILLEFFIFFFFDIHTYSFHTSTKCGVSICRKL